MTAEDCTCLKNWSYDKWKICAIEQRISPFTPIEVAREYVRLHMACGNRLQDIQPLFSSNSYSRELHAQIGGYGRKNYQMFVRIGQDSGLFDLRALWREAASSIDSPAQRVLL